VYPVGASNKCTGCVDQTLFPEKVVVPCAIIQDEFVERMLCPGGKVSRDAGPVKGGDSIIAFVDDPTGYKWEIIGSKGKPIPEPIAQVH